MYRKALSVLIAVMMMLSIIPAGVFAEGETPDETINLTVDLTTVTLTVGDTASVHATVDQQDATLTWSSEKPGIATVDNDGTIKGVSAGTATITVTATKGDQTKEATVTVTVEEKATPETPDITADDVTVCAGCTPEDSKAVVFHKTPADLEIESIEKVTADSEYYGVAIAGETVTITAKKKTDTPETLELKVKVKGQDEPIVVPVKVTVTEKTNPDPIGLYIAVMRYPGSSTGDSKVLSSDANGVIALPKLTYSGYTHVGWTIGENGPSTGFSYTAKPGETSVVFYPVWQLVSDPVYPYEPGYYGGYRELSNLIDRAESFRLRYPSEAGFVPQSKIDEFNSALSAAKSVLANWKSYYPYYDGYYGKYDRSYWRNRFYDRYGYWPSESELETYVRGYGYYDGYYGKYDRSYWRNRFHDRYGYWPSESELANYVRSYGYYGYYGYYDGYYGKYYDKYYGYYGYYGYYNADVKRAADRLVDAIRSIAVLAPTYSGLYRDYANLDYIRWYGYYDGEWKWDGYYGYYYDSYKYQDEQRLKNLMNEADALIAKKGAKVYEAMVAQLRKSQEAARVALKGRGSVAQAIKDLERDIKALENYKVSPDAVRPAYMVGDTMGRFNPNRDITRGEMAVILNRVLGLGNEFTGEGWGQRASENLKYRGVMIGDRKGDMRLNATITMKELVTMLVRMRGYGTVAGNIYGGPITWATGYVQRAYVEGWLEGMDEVRPDTLVTRAQAARIINRAFQRQEAGISKAPSFPDVDRMTKYYEDIRIATTPGIQK